MTARTARTPPRAPTQAPSAPATFCLDLYGPGEAPGLHHTAGAAGALAVLWRVERSRVSHAWATRVEGDLGGALVAESADKLAASRLFLGAVMERLFDSYGPEGIGRMALHYNDYASIPTVG